MREGGNSKHMHRIKGVLLKHGPGQIPIDSVQHIQRGWKMSETSIVHSSEFKGYQRSYYCCGLLQAWHNTFGGPKLAAKACKGGSDCKSRDELRTLSLGFRV